MPSRDEGYRVAKDGHCFLDRAYRDGTIRPEDYGRTIGYVHQQTGPDPTKLWPKPILNAGPVQVGAQSFLLGVAARDRRYWIADGTRLMCWRGARREVGTPSPRDFSPARLTQWADACVRDFLGRIVSGSVERTVEPAAAAYRALVLAHADRTILDLARLGVSRSRLDMAQAVAPDWTAEHLAPRAPTLRHAVVVSLVLGLTAEHSVELIEHAAILEYRVPLIDRAGATAIYAHARNLLATLCPSWWGRGAATDWAALGTTIEGLWAAQWVRQVNEATARSVPITALTAVQAANLMQPDTELAGGG